MSSRIGDYPASLRGDLLSPLLPRHTQTPLSEGWGMDALGIDIRLDLEGRRRDEAPGIPTPPTKPWISVGISVGRDQVKVIFSWGLDLWMKTRISLEVLILEAKEKDDSFLSWKIISTVCYGQPHLGQGCGPASCWTTNICGEGERGHSAGLWSFLFIHISSFSSVESVTLPLSRYFCQTLSLGLQRWRAPLLKLTF